MVVEDDGVDGVSFLDVLCYLFVVCVWCLVLDDEVYAFAWEVACHPFCCAYSSFVVRISGADVVPVPRRVDVRVPACCSGDVDGVVVVGGDGAHGDVDVVVSWEEFFPCGVCFVSFAFGDDLGVDAVFSFFEACFLIDVSACYYSSLLVVDGVCSFVSVRTVVL